MLAIGILSIFLLQEPVEERPVCDADTVGLMWPNEANLNPQALQKLAKSGELWLCTKHPWRYKWEKPAVHFAQLKKEREEKKKR
jgi:hypothetical protein